MNTSYTFLYYKTSAMSAFAKLVDITTCPSPRSKPDKGDTSNLSQGYETCEPTVRRLSDQDYECLYSKAIYDKLVALEGTQVQYQLRYGPNGEYGCWQWTGDIFFQPSGGGFGDIRKGTISFYPASDIVAVDPTVVFITPIGDKAVADDDSIVVTVFAIPDDATIGATSGTTAVATVSVTDNYVTITGASAGTSLISVTATKAGLTTGTETFTVTVS